MLHMLARNWWVAGLRGVFAIVFGVLTVIWPSVTLLVLVTLFGAYAFVDGILAIVNGISSYGDNKRWWAVLLEGIAGVVVGVVAFVLPGITALSLVYVIAAWALITGVFEIAAAIQLRREMTGEWVMILSGVASILFAVFLFAAPGAGALGLTVVIGVYAIVFGFLMIGLALRLRRLGHTNSPGGTSFSTP